jgi:hypothetical protein
MDASHLDLHGCLDGFTVTFHGEEVATWPTLTGAARGLTSAKWALAELARVLAKQPQPRSA